MSGEFHNPYHFVPVSGENGPGCVGCDPAEWPAHITHDRYLAASSVEDSTEAVHSGRVVCRARVEELLAVGAEQVTRDRQPRRVALFRLNDQWALPGSSLRGMIAAIAETASNSTLRVLADEDLSLTLGRGAGRTTPGRVHQYFRAVNPNLVPLRRGDDRDRLTPAEQLFGFVEETERSPGRKEEALLSLGSRVRFSNGLPYGEARVAPAETTRILASPKFRYPSFHFDVRAEGGTESRFIGKASLSVKTHVPKGRKFYLHRPHGHAIEWATQLNDPKDAEQKAQVAPLMSGEFWFHVDFDNLSQLELQLLCYALRPSETFRHKLGLGKPLGLGKLEVTPMGVFLVDREQRYRSLTGPRYARGWRTADSLPPPYQREEKFDACDPSFDPRVLADGYRGRLAGYPGIAAILQALELIGDPHKVRHPVHYPQVPVDNSRSGTGAGAIGQRGGATARGLPPHEEKNLYVWFQRNDSPSEGGQYLRSLTEKETGGYCAVPSLYRQTAKRPPILRPAPPATGTSSAPRPAPATKAVTAERSSPWVGPVTCICTGRSKSKQYKFKVNVDGREMVGILSPTSPPLPAGEKFEEGRNYEMEYEGTDPRNMRFRLSQKRP